MNDLEVFKKSLIERQKRIAAERDSMRDFVNEVESICESLDQAEDELQDAVASIQCAIDTMSEYQ